MKYLITPSIALASFLSLSACSDPAEKTADATVAESAPVAVASEGKSYLFTGNSKIGFIGSKVTGSHEGGFNDFGGHFVIEDSQPTAGAFTIQMDSTWSDSEKLTGHLKSADFFDVANHPTATFEMTAFTQKAEGLSELSGNLTLRGTTMNITFPTSIAVTGDTINITAEFDINRKDFAIVYPGKTDDLIRDSVIIKFTLEAEPKA